jgi:outer membrane protein TolC
MTFFDSNRSCGRRSFIPLVAAALSLAGGGAHALSLEEAVALAVARNARVLPDRAGAVAVRLAPDAAKVFPNPAIEAEAVPVTITGEYEAEVGVSQALPLWGRRAAGVALAKAEVERRGWISRDAERLVASGARERYRLVVLLEERRDVLQALWNEEVELVRVARARFPHGGISEIDLGQFEARATSRRAAVAAVEAELHAARTDLALWIGMPDTSELRLEAIPPVSLPAMESLKAGLGERPDVMVVESQLRIADAQVRHVRAERFDDPELGILVRWKQEDSSRSRTFFGSRLSVPLPWPSTRTASIELARARAGAARVASESARRVAEEELATAAARAEGALRALSVFTQGAVDSIRSTVILARRVYAEGRIEASAMISAAQTSLQFELERLDALEKWFGAVALVEEQVNRTLAPSIPR